MITDYYFRAEHRVPNSRECRDEGKGGGGHVKKGKCRCNCHAMPCNGCCSLAKLLRVFPTLHAIRSRIPRLRCTPLNEQSNHSIRWDSPFVIQPRMHNTSYIHTYIHTKRPCYATSTQKLTMTHNAVPALGLNSIVVKNRKEKNVNRGV